MAGALVALRVQRVLVSKIPRKGIRMESPRRSSTAAKVSQGKGYRRGWTAGAFEGKVRKQTKQTG